MLKIFYIYVDENTDMVTIEVLEHAKNRKFPLLVKNATT